LSEDGNASIVRPNKNVTIGTTDHLVIGTAAVGYSGSIPCTFNTQRRLPLRGYSGLKVKLTIQVHTVPHILS